jgi:diguanylate cyclase (GGDEF)-like protein/PAS domain S-box-containing protein
VNQPGTGSSPLVRELTLQLSASEVRLHNIIERSPDAFVITDSQGTIQFANQAAFALFGKPESALVGRSFGLPVVAGETAEVDIVSARNEAQVAEMRVVETEWDGKKAYIAVLRDITERSRVERVLKENEKRLTLAMEAAQLGFWDIDLRTGRVTCNDKLFTLLGYLPGEVAPRPEAWRRLVHPDDLPRVEQAFDEHLRGKTPVFRIECRLRAKSGTWSWVFSQGEVMERSLGGEPLRMIGVTENIDERKEVAEKMRHVLQHDPLTGLANRALLYEFGERVLSSARRGGRGCAFLFVDLDRFKPINDTYGHDVGDAVLKEVARRLATCVRSEDLVGRLGGDEFLTVLSHIRNGEDAAKVARHVLHRLDRPYLVDSLLLHVSPSIGISLFPQDGHSVDALIKNADTAMYHAKKSGRDNFQFFKKEFNERASQALKIESRLHSGLKQQEFVLFYQPVLDTETQAIVGAEALLRWPAMNALPEQFIAVAETAGFMPTLGEWVMQQACRQLRAWRDKGFLSFPVAIKVSPTQFRQKNFARSVGDALEQACLSAEDLCLEMTESTVMKSVDEAAGVLSSLKELGVKVGLDDFGTGYSSLSDLSRLPIDILKLDQSFVQAIGRNGARGGAMADGIIALGRALGLEVSAEGIESAESLAFLKARHCRRGQGFHFCRPLPVREFEQWSRARAV